MESIVDAKFALIRAAKARGEPLSQEEYQSWKAEQDDIDTTAKAIREILGDGDWCEACRVTGITPADGRKRATTYTVGELEAALRQAADEMGEPLRVADYQSWRANQPSTQPSPMTIADHLGTGKWSGACDAFGIESGQRGKEVKYSTDTLEETLTRAAEARGEPLTMSQYNSWRADHDDELPSPSLFAHRLGDGSWREACRSVGVAHT